MDELKLQHLLARKYSPFDKNRLRLPNRIKDEHLFVSIDEALEYLYKVIKHEDFNPDNIAPIKMELSSNFIINVVDEAICSIIRELFRFRNVDDQDSLGYYYPKLEAFWEEICNIRDQELYDYRDYDIFYTALMYIIYNLMNLAMPKNEKEEVSSKVISRAYYYLMYWMYVYATKDYYTDYNRNMENTYYTLYDKEILTE